MCCSVNGSVCLVCGVFGETIRNVFAILLLNVMEVFNVGGGALLDTPYVKHPYKMVRMSRKLKML